FSSGDWISDAPGATPQKLMVQRYSVGSSFFDLYAIPILRGRIFEQTEAPDSVIVGERLAGLLWPGLDPIGRSFRFGQESLRVIGLAREMHLPAIDPRTDNPEFYQPFTDGGSRFTINLRCDDACPDAAVIRKRIQEASPGVDVWRVEVLD